MNFILAPSATRDLDRLSQYFLETNIEAGERLFKALNQKFYSLTKFPNLGKLYPHLDPNIRGLTIEKYIIFYRVTETQIE
jgi:toxin ParE1/3/4